METSTDRFLPLRQQMVAEQLAGRGITDWRVLAAMEVVPRHEFIPADIVERAYHDRALPIGWNQTISQPYTVAFMCAALELTGDETVLEVGTGSGYCAAVLSLLCRSVITVERIAELADTARERLARLGFQNIEVQHAAGVLGWPAAAPYERIVVAAGANFLPSALTDQLADGGRMIIPVRTEDGQTSQTMLSIARDGSQFHEQRLGEFVFVPLITDEDPPPTPAPTA